MTLPNSPEEQYLINVHEHLHELISSLTPRLRISAYNLVSNPGKYFRSHLLEICSRFGSPNRRRIVKLGALVELLHLASLLHDDVIDRAASRRNRPAAHVLAGHEIAVLTGAACMALVGQEAATMGDGIAQAVSATAAELAYGELLDIERAFDFTISVEDYTELARRKTGALFQLACVLGAGEASGARATFSRLSLFGQELGVAFQISDDCLDLWSNVSDKPMGTDHLLGLFGLPTLCALHGGESELKERLMSPDLGINDLAVIRDLVAAAGGVEKASAIARLHFNEALHSLGPLRETLAGAALVAASEKAWQR